MGIAVRLPAILIGILTGVITSLMGGSAVMIVVPVLTLAFGFDTHAAIGTSLFVDVITSLVVAWFYHKHGHIKLKPGLWIAGASVLGAQLGVQVASVMGERGLSSSFSLVSAGMGALMVAKAAQGKGFAVEGLKRLQPGPGWPRRIACILVGLIIGVLSGIFGAGGGIMILFALVILLAFPLHDAVGTSTLIMAVTAFSSTTGYVVRGYVDFVMGGFLTAGAVAGAVLGSRFANRIDERSLRFAVGGLLFLIGLAMFFMKKT
jgi:uncharacterized protein